MKGEDLKPVMVVAGGYWPSPMAPEEVMAWAEILTGHQRITPEEAKTCLRLHAESGAPGSEFRPKPGQMVPMVQGLRRKRATGRPIAELPGPQDFSSDVVKSTLANCREAIARNKDELARRAEERRKALSTTTAA